MPICLCETCRNRKGCFQQSRVMPRCDSYLPDIKPASRTIGSEMNNPGIKDKEKIIAIAGILDEKQGGIEGEELSSVIFLLEKKFPGSFNYSFNIRIHPSSDDLDEDIDDLIHANIISSRARIELTEAGKQLRESLRLRSARFIDSIMATLEKLIRLTAKDLRQEVYRQVLGTNS